MSDTKTCPKCHQPMNSGFIADRSPEKNYVSWWVEGEPEPSFWKGTKNLSVNR